MLGYEFGGAHVVPTEGIKLSSKVRLTDAFAARAQLPDGYSDHVTWDADVIGFGLRLRSSGKSWILMYRPAGSGRSGIRKRMKIGVPGQMKAADARNQARILLGRIASGSDPLADRKAVKLKERSRLADMLDRYEKDLIRRNYVNAPMHVRGLRTKLASLINTDVREITGAQLATIIERYEATGRRGGDFRTRTRAFFSWLVSKPKIIPANPLAGFRKERATRADRIAREEHGRSLNDAELVEVWKAADEKTVFGRWIRFLILTGCRRGEAAGLEWAMVDRQEKVIRLPAVFTKQGRGHAVPIAPALAAVLEACPVDARSDLVFASPRTGGRMSGFTQLHGRLMKASGVEFLTHDLRRTFRTGLSRLRVDTETAELALGHARGDLEARYNRDAALEEQREAFMKWAEHVSGLISADADGDKSKPVNDIFG